MQGRIKILPKIFLATGVITLFLIVRYQNEIKSFINHLKVTSGIYLDNFFFEVGSNVQRRRPISLQKKETELLLYIGEPFRNFTPEDWKEFWNIIYGGFLKPHPESPNLPKLKRQLTEEEIILELKNLYPTPFVLFTTANWQLFFDIIYRK